jgi:flagellar basal-body rod protein FlgB
VNISFDNALGIHTKALSFRAARAEVIANNIINADTPGYKARDIQFSDSLKAAQHPVQVLKTHDRHIGVIDSSSGHQKLYRMPLLPSLDGNTVNAEMEESNYMRNALEFQTSFTFLNGKFKGLSAAIKGE